MVRRRELIMGMPITIAVVGTDADDSVEAAFAEFRCVDKQFSPYISTSEISKFNRGEVTYASGSPLLREVIERCLSAKRATNGFFNAYHDGTFDPSGLVKGWAIRRVAASLVRRGHADYFVDAGGDIVTAGHHPDGRLWRVGVRHPLESSKYAHTLELTNLAVATSATYERGEHIYSPYTGRSAKSLLSVTIIGPDIETADVLATAAFSSGKNGLELVQKTTGYFGFLIDTELQTYATPGYERYLSQ